VVAWNMSEVPHLIRLVRGSPASDVAVLVITFSLTVFVDLVVAVNVGVILAALIFMRRMSLAVNVEAQVESTADNKLPAGPLPAGVVVYSIEGPLFFGAAEKLERTLAHIQRPATTLILRMSQVPFVDATGISALDQIITDFLKHDATVLLSEVRTNVLHKLERAGLVRRLGADNLTATLALALERVKAVDTVRETCVRIGQSCKSTAH
jgi:sulfate permease, SulP family